MIPTDGPTIVGDSIRLEQVFTNLLSNALKFTPKGGRISVALTLSGSRAAVTVVDTGSGIDGRVLPHIFDAFRQGCETLQHSPHGLGLGLAIAKYLIERHDGTIAVNSEGPGRGSMFMVSLPQSQHHEPVLAEQIDHGHRPDAAIH